MKLLTKGIILLGTAAILVAAFPYIKFKKEVTEPRCIFMQSHYETKKLCYDKPDPNDFTEYVIERKTNTPANKDLKGEGIVFMNPLPCGSEVYERHKIQNPSAPCTETK